MDSDQATHIIESSLTNLLGLIANNTKNIQTDSEDWDQSALMPMLISLRWAYVFDGTFSETTAEITF